MAPPAEEAFPLPPRPLTRGDCVDGERPCPWVGCRFHLYLHVDRKGELHLTDADLEVWEMAETCALDLAERGGPPDSGLGPGSTLAEVGAALNVTRERVRQIEVKALFKVQRMDRFRGGALAEQARDSGFRGPVRAPDDDASAVDAEDEEDADEHG